MTGGKKLVLRQNEWGSRKVRNDNGRKESAKYLPDRLPERAAFK